MKRRTRWVLLIAVGATSLAVGALVVSLQVHRFALSTHTAFNETCRQQIIALEPFAEHWIIRGEIESLRRALELLLLGNAAYGDVVLEDQVLISVRGDAQHVTIPPLKAGDSIHLRSLVVDLGSGDLEVRVPIILAGYPDTPAGLIRVGYSGAFARSKVWLMLLKTIGIAIAAWAGLLTVLWVVLWRSYRKPSPQDRDDAAVAEFGAFRIDRKVCRGTYDGQDLDLPPKLYQLLLLLVERGGEVVSDQAILDSVWAGSAYAASADVKQHIYLLRRAIAGVCHDPKRVIINVKGFGYRLASLPIEDEMSAD